MGFAVGFSAQYPGQYQLDYGAEQLDYRQDNYSLVRVRRHCLARFEGDHYSGAPDDYADDIDRVGQVEAVPRRQNTAVDARNQCNRNVGGHDYDGYPCSLFRPGWYREYPLDERTDRQRDDDGEETRHREREQGRRLHIARAGVVARAVIGRNEFGNGATHSQIEQPEITYKRSDKRPYPIGRCAQFSEDIGSQEEADDRAE